MSTARKNTLVVDFGVLPIRPEISDVEDFIYNKMKLNQADATAIQFHNIHHCVYIEMVDNDKPMEYQRQHNLEHTMACNKMRFKIPVYRDNDAVNVRIFDLPPSLEQKVVIEHMRQYGTILSVRFEYWRNFFGGLKNGVRVFRMLLNKPVPSYIKVGPYESSVSHSGPEQVKTCRFCNEPLHPKKKCAAVSQEKKGAAPTQTATQVQISHEDFPELTPRERIANENRPEPQQQKATKSRDDDALSSSSDTESISSSSKKKARLTTKKATNKEPRQAPAPMDSSLNAENYFVVLSPMDVTTEDNN